MLRRVTIQNYVLIDNLDIEFPEGLNIITGETGAGKSILLGALSLLLGAKADASVLGDKNRNCVVEACFDCPDELIARRVISPQGRSRAFIDDEPVTMDLLKGTVSGLIDIHAQHQHLLLADRHFQMSVLDGFASILPAVAEYNSHYSEFLAKNRQISDLDIQIANGEKEREFLEFQYDQLAAAHLADGELDDLEAEQKLLANAEMIKENLSAAESLFGSDEISIDGSLKEMASLLSHIGGFVPKAGELVSRLDSARIELKDIRSEVTEECEKVVSSPERLQEVEARLTLLYNLMRKHSVSSIAELMAVRDEISAKLEAGVDLTLERAALVKEMDEIASKCNDEAEKLHIAREKASSRLSSALQESIRSLEMPHALFEITVVKRTSWGPDGADEVSFNFSANGTSEMKEVSKCASGGEMSRIMLCIKALMSKYVGMPSLIFDEIDTGVSGSIADKMGRMIGEMSANMQVFAITHLPQVASKGTAHFLVYKEFDDTGKAKTYIRRIDGQERTLEIARMLSGSHLTEQAMANARVLLNENTINPT